MVRPSFGRRLTLVAATLVAIVAMAYVVPVVAQTNNAGEARAAQAQEKKPAEKAKAQQKTAPPTGSILLGVGVGVLLVGAGLLARSRISPRSTSEDGGFVGAVRRVVFRPVGFFRGLPRSGNFANPLLFALICIEVSTVLGWLLVLIGLGKTPSFNPNPQTLGLPSVFTPAFPIVSVLLAPIIGAIGILIAAGIQQLLVRLIVGSRNSGYEATFRVGSYTQVTNLVNWIPIIGPLLALYGLYLAVVGIREMHGTTTGKAALVILIPFGVVLLVALVVLLIVGVALFAQR
jgi:hypothetical protein